jgi:hypothetical protein
MPHRHHLWCSTIDRWEIECLLPVAMVQIALCQVGRIELVMRRFGWQKCLIWRLLASQMTFGF